MLIHISHIVLVSLPARLFRYCSVFCAVAAISSPSIVLASSTAVAAPISLESLRELRREAMHRSRRIIFNNDGMDAVFKPRTEDSIEGILKLSTSALAGSHVDTIAYNTNIGGFGLFFHNTKVGEIFTSREGIWLNNMTGPLIQQGTDPLRIMVDFARANRMEIFWSLRMNNTHDNKYPELFSKFKRENPDFLMGTIAKPPQRGSWSAVDFGQPKVRDFICRIVEEVCRNYDIDGVQLDYWRFPVLFRSTAEGRSPTSAERADLTEMMRRIRGLSEEIGLARGRPLLLALRVPDSIEYCREVIGIELEQWLKEGMIDVLCVGGDVQLNPWEKSIALGRRFDVPVYPSFREAGTSIAEQLRPMRDAPEGWRGAALDAWSAGASGIEVFNLMHVFPPEHPLYRELGDPHVLRRRDRTYVATRRGPPGEKSWFGMGASRINLPIITPNNPLMLIRGQPVSVPLWLGESEPATIHAARVRLNLPGLTKDDALSLLVNGKPAIYSGSEGDWAEFDVSPVLLAPGKNSLVIQMVSRALALHDLSLQIIASQ